MQEYLATRALGGGESEGAVGFQETVASRCGCRLSVFCVWCCWPLWWWCSRWQRGCPRGIGRRFWPWDWVQPHRQATCTAAVTSCVPWRPAGGPGAGPSPSTTASVPSTTSCWAPAWTTLPLPLPSTSTSSFPEVDGVAKGRNSRIRDHIFSYTFIIVKIRSYVITDILSSLSQPVSLTCSSFTRITKILGLPALSGGRPRSGEIRPSKASV